MRKLLLTGAAALALAGCTRYEPVTDFSPAPAAERQSPPDTPIQTETGMQAEAEQYASLVRSLYAVSYTHLDVYKRQSCRTFRRHW